MDATWRRLVAPFLLAMAFADPLSAAEVRVGDRVIVGHDGPAEGADRIWAGTIDYVKYLRSDEIQLAGRKVWIRKSAAISIEKAEAYFAEQLRLSPTSVEALRGRACLNLDSGRCAEAARDLILATQSTPTDAISWRKLGIAHLALGEFKNAEADFGHYIGLVPNDGSGRVFRAMALLGQAGVVRVTCKGGGADFTLTSRTSVRNLSQNVWEKVEAEFAAGLNSKEIDPDAHLYRGLCLFHRGDRPAAIDDFGGYLRLVPDSERAYRFRGYALMEQNKYTEAIRDFRRALELDPNNKQVKASAAACKAYSGGRIEDYSAALELDPENFGLVLNRGITFFNRQDYQSAIRDFNRAMAINSESELPWLYRGISSMYSLDYDKGMSDFSEAVRLNPKSPVCLAWRGAAYLAKKKIKEALSDVDSALALDEECQVAHEQKGYALYLTGDFAGSIRCLNKAIELKSSELAPRVGRCEAYRALKDYDQALKFADEIVKLFPKEPAGYLERAKALQEMGRDGDAQEDIRQAEILKKSNRR